MAIPCGVDFGTSNSVFMAMQHDGPPKVIKSVQGDTLHASAIFYPHNSTDPLVIGKPALVYLPDANVIIQPKRAIGIAIKTLRDKGLIDVFNAKIANGRGKVRFSLDIDGKTVERRVETVVEDMLKHFVKLVILEVGPQVSFVFSRPMFWNVEQTSLFKKAAEAAVQGKSVVDIITEPMGGQFAYSDRKPADASNLLIVDLGAGTYDLSLLREKTPGNFVSIATGGDDLLGGSDVELIFFRALENEMKSDNSFKPAVLQKRKTALLAQLKELKHQLSMAPSARITVFGATDDEEGFMFEIDQAKKVQLLQDPFYKRIEQKTNEMFDRKTANLKTTSSELKAQVQAIYPIGGPQRDPFLIDQIIHPMFPNAKIIGRPGTEGALNPDEVVAYGNTLWCAAKLKTDGAKKMGLPEPVHVNILSRSLGVEGITRENGKLISHFCVVIPANTPLPTCKEEKGFSTSVDNQKIIRISVFQGNGKLTGDDGMEFLGSFSIPMELPNLIDGPMITVEMEVNDQNLLVVRAGENNKMEEKEFEEVA